MRIPHGDGGSSCNPANLRWAGGVGAGPVAELAEAIISPACYPAGVLERARMKASGGNG